MVIQNHDSSYVILAAFCFCLAECLTSVLELTAEWTGFFMSLLTVDEEYKSDNSLCPGEEQFTF
jgi:hypothetical protein